MPRFPALLASVLVLSAAADSRAADEDRSPLARKPGWVDVFATVFVGDGLRFNNPYRLSTVLGSDAESLSRTSAYVDLGAAVAVGNALGFAHGLALRTSIALEGVRQTVLTPSYVLWRRWRAWAAYARGGVAIVTNPDPTWGLEAAGGGVWFVRAGVGIAAELVGDVFYGAGTREVAIASYPVLSAQAGLVLSWEAMP